MLQPLRWKQARPLPPRRRRELRGSPAPSRFVLYAEPGAGDLVRASPLRERRPPRVTAPHGVNDRFYPRRWVYRSCETELSWISSRPRCSYRYGDPTADSNSFRAAPRWTCRLRARSERNRDLPLRDVGRRRPPGPCGDGRSWVPFSGGWPEGGQAFSRMRPSPGPAVLRRSATTAHSALPGAGVRAR
jgi:hypothetical protein